MIFPDGFFTENARPKKRYFQHQPSGVHGAGDFHAACFSTNLN